MRTFNKKVRPRELRIGDMVLKEIRNTMGDPREKGKFKPNWLGPFLIKEIFSGGGVRLVDLNGNLFAEPTNMDQLKKIPWRPTQKERKTIECEKAY
ncbi:hypothetical protein ACB098_11G090700 [Castanea mollissima]